MDIKYLTKKEAEQKYLEWCTNNYQIGELSESYQKLRNDLLTLFSSVDGLDEYEMDIQFGIKIYKYFENIFPNFSMRLASDEDFWRYICVCVVPEIVKKRWFKGTYNGIVDHYYEKGVRIYLRAIWWYIHLSKQDNLEDTLHLLQSPNCNEDVIQGLVERPGKKGTYVDVYRRIMKKYSEYSPEKISFYNKYIAKGNEKFFRCLMKFNTAHIVSTEPGLYLNGIDGYVDFLFDEMEASINATKNS